MLRATPTSSQRRLHERAAEAHRRRVADGMEHAVDPVPDAGHGVAHRGHVRGIGHVQLEDRRRRGELAGGPLGERQPPAGPGEHDLGALGLGQLGHTERERRVGEDARDDDVLALEKTHAQHPSDGPRRRSRTLPCARLSAMRIGILGGTGPAGTALGARLASVGYEVVLGSRSAERAVEVRDEIVARWPDLYLPHRGRRQRGRRRRAARGDRHAVGQRGHHCARRSPTGWRARSSSRWATPSCGSATSSSRSCLPRGSVAAHVQAAVPGVPGRRRLPAPPGPRARQPRRTDRLRRPDLQRRSRGDEGGVGDRQRDPGLPSARRWGAVQRHGHRGVHGGAAPAQRALQDPSGPKLTGIKPS